MSRILVVGLDGATLDLIAPWVEEGHLPNFGRLLEEGQGGELPSTVPPMTPPAWTTFATGTTPGAHGIFDWTYRREASYETVPFSAADIRVKAMWEYLSERGERSLVINVPMTYPPRPLAGVMIAGMPAPKWDDSVVHPKSLFSEIDDVADYIVYPDPGEAYSTQGVDSFIDVLARAAEGRMQAWRHLRAQDDFTFEMVAFNGTDTAQHALWHLMDPEHHLHDPSAPEHQRHAIRDYYVRMDRYLGEFMKVAEDEQRMLVVMSDHGAGRLKGLIHVNNWLLDEGLLVLKRSAMARVKHSLYRIGFTPTGVYDRLVRLGLGRLKSSVVRGRGRSLLTTLFLSFQDVDWDRTTAYSIGNVGQLYLNVAGREPRGFVEPADYATVRKDLEDRLLAWRRADEPVVERVIRPEDIWAGDQLSHGPDLLFLPTGLDYFGFGEFEFGSNRVFEDLRRGITGTHRMNGIGLWWGPGVIRDVKATGVEQRLHDLAPTIIHAAGQPVPAWMQGRVLTEYLVTERTVEGSLDTAGEAPDEGVTFTEEERALIEERLRGLGYV